MKRRLLWQLFPSYALVIATTLGTYIFLEHVDPEGFLNKIALSAASIFVGLLTAYITTRYLINSYRIALFNIRKGIDRLSKGDFSERISVVEAKELYDLAQSLNQMVVELKRESGHHELRVRELDATLSAMREGVVVVNRDQLVTRMNEAAAKILLVSKEEALQKPVYGVIRNVALQNILERSMSHLTPAEGDVVIVDPAERHLQVYATPLRSGDQSYGLLIVLNDITHIQKLENVRREFVANVSHELRTPITSIKGFVETLLEDDNCDPEESRRFLEIIARQVERLIAIFDDLLSLSRIEQQEGRGDLQFELIPLRDFLEGALAPFEPRAKEKKITIDIESCDESATFNRNLMEQALSNLVDNSLKLSPDNTEIKVRCSLNEGMVRFSVSDQGPGIEREHLSRIFERFYRVDKGRSRKVGGTGLGLSIVKHVAQLHGGTVEVESVFGEGSCFTILFPRK